MEKSKKDSSKNLEQKVKEHQAVLLKYPKNIRQIGEVRDGQRIYVEDYVMTYAMHLATKAGDAYSSAVLLGQKAIVEGRRTLFISGAVEISQQWRQNLSITGEQWTFVYDQIQKYFHDIEIVGWFLTHPGLELEPDEQVHSIWRSSFEGIDKILFLYDSISREDAFYTCKDGEFLRQSGYYIYYEKNEEMQNYMIDEKGGESTDAGYQDKASKKIRQKIHQKNEEHKKYLFHQQMAYSAGIVASAVILVTAATKLHYSTEGEDIIDFDQNSQAVFENDSWTLLGKEKEDTDSTKEGQSITETENNDQKDVEENSQNQETKTEENETENVSDIEEQENQGESNEKSEEKDENEQDHQEEQDSLEENDSNKTSQTSSSESTVGTKVDSEKEEKRYKVKKGDTLESISIACYGTSRYVNKIKKINKLENADKIYIGQELILP